MSIIVKSGVPGKLPTASQLEYGQLAINYADEILYFKNSSNQIVSVGSGAGEGGTVTNVSGTGSVSTSGSLTLGGTLSIAPADFGSQTQKTFLAAPNATNGTPTFRIISASDIPVLNQNTTGNAGTVTNGVYTTGSYADPTWITSINYSKLTGTIPTWNQNTTGSAAALTTGRTISLSGDVTYISPSFDGSANVTATATLASVGTAGTYTKVTTDAKGRVTSGTTLVASDIPVLDASKITTGTVAIANGGTGATTAANARTNLGATTVGSSLLTVADPGAIGFIRVNADNTVTLLDAETFREAIDASHGYAKSFLSMGA